MKTIAPRGVKNYRFMSQNTLIRGVLRHNNVREEFVMRREGCIASFSALGRLRPGAGQFADVDVHAAGWLPRT